MTTEPVHDVEAADAVMAEHDQGFEVTEPFEVGQALRHRTHGNQLRPGEAGNNVFFGLADVDERDGLPVGDSLVDLFHGDLRLATGMHSL
jgi:hypothetical protein